MRRVSTWTSRLLPRRTGRARCQAFTFCVVVSFARVAHGGARVPVCGFSNGAVGAIIIGRIRVRRKTPRPALRARARVKYKLGCFASIPLCRRPLRGRVECPRANVLVGRHCRLTRRTLCAISSHKHLEKFTIFVFPNVFTFCAFTATQVVYSQNGGADFVFTPRSCRDGLEKAKYNKETEALHFLYALPPHL